MTDCYGVQVSVHVCWLALLAKLPFLCLLHLLRYEDCLEMALVLLHSGGFVEIV